MILYCVSGYPTKEKDANISTINKFNKIFKKLLNNIYYKNKVFVHRDFHISNLMITINF